MAENRMSEMIRASLDGIRDFTDVDAVVGNAIITPSGVTVIPVSKITVGFASGGVDLGEKKAPTPISFGGGGGTGVSVTPIAFLTVDREARVNLIPVASVGEGVDRVIDLIEKSPAIIDKIKKSLT